VVVSDLDRRRRFESLFADHSAAVLAYARRRIDAGRADDVLSEVFVVAWRRLDDVPSDALPWLLACARRAIANQRRAARRQNALAERLRDTPTPAPTEPKVQESELRLALRGLGERDREVLMLVAWEGLEPACAAAVLGCSRSAFAMRLHRARRRLAAAIEKDAGTRPDAMEVMR
jgi:RNA polymerase sigma-70 factor (ECF subfamily)